MAEILYVYGTLRPGKNKTVLIPGKLYGLGWFPGMKLGHGPETVVCEPVLVDDWIKYDQYEGYNPDDPKRSLYIRQPLLVPYGLPGFIYEYNQPVDESSLIESGDWLTHTQTKVGSHGKGF